MDPRINPYSPGAGVRPVELAGRDAEVEAFEIMVARALAGRPAQSIMFYGLRGVGKTVLLNELLGSARARPDRVHRPRHGRLHPVGGSRRLTRRGWAVRHRGEIQIDG